VLNGGIRILIAITVNVICPGIIGTQMWYGSTGLAEKWKTAGEIMAETMAESWRRNTRKA
jgi:meso-butanediol dehydrogenase/(S,S)-butanediol dehydrogenase/diacetyl reductase